MAPEFLHLSTSNAMLKVLEEPPGNTLFFLVTNNDQKLISTIKSRVQNFKVKRFSDSEMKKYLSTYKDVSEDEVDQAIYLSDGDINNAQKYLYASNTEDLEKVKIWMRACYSQNFSELTRKLSGLILYLKLRKELFLPIH